MTRVDRRFSNRVALPRDRSARAGVLSALKRSGGIWFGWSGENSEQPAPQPKGRQVGGITYATIDFTAEEFDAYYNGYCNSTLWPLLHFRLGLVEHSRQYQDALYAHQRALRRSTGGDGAAGRRHLDP